MVSAAVGIYGQSGPRLLLALSLNTEPFMDESIYQSTIIQGTATLVTLTAVESENGSDEIKKFASFGEVKHLVVRPPAYGLFRLRGRFVIHGWARPNILAQREDGKYRFNTILSIGMFANGVLIRLGDGNLFIGGEVWINGVVVVRIPDAWFPIGKWTYFALVRSNNRVSFYTRTKDDTTIGHDGTINSAHLRGTNEDPAAMGFVNTNNLDVLVGQSMHKQDNSSGGYENFRGELDRIVVIRGAPLNDRTVPFHL